MTDTLATSTWSEVSLAECCDEIAQRVDNPSESGFDRFVGLEHLETGGTSVRSWGSTNDVTSSMKLFKTGDVIVARRNVYLRRAARAGFDGVCSGDGIVLRGNPAVCLPDLLPFLLNTNGFWDYVTSQADGTMSKRITVKRLLAYEFPLPPIEEQRRIAEMLNSASSYAESLVNAKQEAASLLDSLRETSFHLAPNKSKQIGDVASVRYGLGQPPPESNDGIAMIRATNISKGRIDATGMVHIDFNAIPVARKLLLKEGDIIVVRSGAYTGDSALVTPRWEGSIAGYDLVIQPDQNLIHPEYLAQFLLSTRTVVQKLRPLSARTAQPHLNKEDVLGVTFPYSDLSDQRSIAEEMARIQQSLEMIDVRRNQVNQIKSNLLRIAFREEK